MNTNTPRLPTTDTTPAPRRTDRREERSFGTGYGRSSGYADPDRRYAGTAPAERFRVH